jgi:hypothetical protein
MSSSKKKVAANGTVHKESPMKRPCGKCGGPMLPKEAQTILEIVMLTGKSKKAFATYHKKCS